MPKKKNFLGGMQNYNPNTGEYEPALKGPNGESPSGFKSFKKTEDKDESFDTVNKKRINGGKYGSSWKEGESLSQSELEVFNEISKMKKEGNYDRKKLKEKFEGITDEDIDNMEKAYQIDNPQNNESFDADAFEDEIDDAEKELMTSGLDEEEFAKKIDLFKKELNQNYGAIGEDDYNRLKEKLDRLSKPEKDESFEEINNKRMGIDKKVAEWQENNPEGKVLKDKSVEEIEEESKKEEPAKENKWEQKYGYNFLKDSDSLDNYNKLVSYNYDGYRYVAKYRDKTGRTKMATFKTEEQAKKWAEDEYNKGVLEVTPEQAKEISKRYGKVDSKYQTSPIGGKYEVGKTVHTGLTSQEDMEIINGVLGQLTDGIWENTKIGRKYGGNIKVNRTDDGEIILDATTVEGLSPYNGMSGQQIMGFLAGKLKEVVDREIKDGSSAKWEENDETKLDYLNNQKVSNVMKIYNILLGKNRG